MGTIRIEMDLVRKKIVERVGMLERSKSRKKGRRMQGRKVERKKE